MMRKICIASFVLLFNSALVFAGAKPFHLEGQCPTRYQLKIKSCAPLHCKGCPHGSHKVEAVIVGQQDLSRCSVEQRKKKAGCPPPCASWQAVQEAGVKVYAAYGECSLYGIGTVVETYIGISDCDVSGGVCKLQDLGYTVLH